MDHEVHQGMYGNIICLHVKKPDEQLQQALKSGEDDDHDLIT